MGKNRIDFFTEEESAEIVLKTILPQLIPDNNFKVFHFNGNRDLEQKLPIRLNAYKHENLSSTKIIILMDRDNNKCTEAKSKLESILNNAGIISKKENPTDFQAVTRIVIDELESWYFGDINALHSAYPSIPITLGTKSKYRDPDTIKKPSEKLFQLLSNKEYKGLRHLPKLDTASKISPYMDCFSNTSQSFIAFREAVQSCLNLK